MLPVRTLLCSLFVLLVGLPSAPSLAAAIVERGDDPPPAPPPPPPPPPEEQDETNENETEPEKEDEEAGDPVTLFTGNFHLEETDLVLPGRGLDLEFHRTYHNGTAVHSYLGPKWDLSLFQRVVIQYKPFVQLYYGPQDTVGRSPFTLPRGSVGGVTGGVSGGGLGGGHGTGGEGGSHEGGFPGVVGVGGLGGSVSFPTEVVEGVYYYDGKNGIDQLTPGDSQNQWERPAGHFDRFLAFGDDPDSGGYHPQSFYMRSPNGTIHGFEQLDKNSPLVGGTTTTYWLTYITDRSGNTIQLQYEAVGPAGEKHYRPEKAIDDLGREITFDYTDELLTSITDFTGRVVTYAYEDGLLHEVTSPALASQAGAGRTRRYEYGIAGSSTARCIEKIFNPMDLEEDPLNPVPFLVNTFDDAGQRVIAQTIGGTNSSGIEAGGRYLFLAEIPPSPIDRGWMEEGGRVVVVSPGGNVTATVFDPQGFNVLSYKFTGRFNPNHPVFADPDTVDVDGLVRLDLLSEATATDAQLNFLNPDTHYLPAFEPPLRSSDPPCYVTKRTFDGNGMLIEEKTARQVIQYQYDDLSPDRFQRGNLLRVEKAPNPDDGSRIVTGFAYEPLFNQQRAYINPRGMDPLYVPSNGGPWSLGRYMTTSTFDYQEGDLSTTWLPTVNLWQIDLLQNSSYGALPGLDAALPRILDVDNLGDVNGDGKVDQSQGNPIVQTDLTAHVMAPDSIGDPHPTFVPQSVESRMVFDDFGQVVSATDSRGFTTEHWHYPASDPLGLQGAPPSPGGGGFVGQTILPDGATESTAYDAVGRVVAQTDAVGAVTVTEWNELDEITRTINPMGHATSYVHDANGNVVEEVFDHVQPGCDPITGLPTGQDEALGDLVRYSTYDILNQLVEVDAPHDGSSRAVTRYRYDRDGNQVVEFLPESFLKPNDVISQVFDERGLLLSMTRGGLVDGFSGSSAHSALLSDPAITAIAPATSGPEQKVTERYQYDEHENLEKRIDAAGHAWSSTYDNFDRLIKATSPLGDEEIQEVGLMDEILEIRSYEGDETSGTLLAHSVSRFDEHNRTYESNDLLRADDAVLPVTDGPLSPADGWVTVRRIFDEGHHVTMRVDDSRRFEGRAYDSRGNAIAEWDGSCAWLPGSDWTVPGSQRTEYVRDQAGRVIEVKVTEFHEDGSSVTLTDWIFRDSLGRVTARTNELGHTTRILYDSRSNAVFESDSNSGDLSASYLSTLVGYGEHLGVSSVPTNLVINNHGNVVHRRFDGASREVEVLRFLKQGGVGDGSPDSLAAGDGLVTTTIDYDRDGRVIGREDDNGQRTEYEYDALGRRQVTIFADGETLNIVSYDPRGFVADLVDLRGTGISNTHDAAGRLISRSIQPGPGVSGSSAETYVYDGLGRLISATDDDSGFTRVYDSMNHLLEEWHNGVPVLSSVDGVGNRTHVGYPSGRFIERRFDPLNRLHEVIDSNSGEVIAEYEYRGSSRMKQRTVFPEGEAIAQQRFFDEIGRVVESRSTRSSDSSALDSWLYEWDRNGNKTRRENSITGVVHTYLYDSLDQMVRSTRTGSSADRVREYRFDGVGNREVVIQDTAAQAYEANEMHEYTSILPQAMDYDDAGNLTSMSAQMTYDFKNQMTLHDVGGRSGKSNYQYDALGRRIVKETAVATSHAYYLGWDVLEEQGSEGDAVATYVYGSGLDDLLTLQTDADGDGQWNRFVYHRDDLGNVTKLSDESGVVVEAYDYDDYGMPLNAQTFQPVLAASSSLNDRFFSGRPYDRESGLYYFRQRYLSPTLGRFTTRDPIGQWGDSKNRGNPYTYAGNNPWSLVDPMGTETEEEESPEERRERLEKEQKERLEELKRLRKEGKIGKKEYRQLRDQAQQTLDDLRSAGSDVMSDPAKANDFLDNIEARVSDLGLLTEMAQEIQKLRKGDLPVPAGSTLTRRELVSLQMEKFEIFVNLGIAGGLNALGAPFPVTALAIIGMGYNSYLAKAFELKILDGARRGVSAMWSLSYDEIRWADPLYTGGNGFGPDAPTSDTDSNDPLL